MERLPTCVPQAVRVPSPHTPFQSLNVNRVIKLASKKRFGLSTRPEKTGGKRKNRPQVEVRVLLHHLPSLTGMFMRYLCRVMWNEGNNLWTPVCRLSDSPVLLTWHGFHYSQSCCFDAVTKLSDSHRVRDRNVFINVRSSHPGWIIYNCTGIERQIFATEVWHLHFFFWTPEFRW
jgi:hypothetical protein